VPLSILFWTNTCNSSFILLNLERSLFRNLFLSCYSLSLAKEAVKSNTHPLLEQMLKYKHEGYQMFKLGTISLSFSYFVRLHILNARFGWITIVS
jgi:hypothetical protein